MHKYLHIYWTDQGNQVATVNLLPGVNQLLPGASRTLARPPRLALNMGRHYVLRLLKQNVPGAFKSSWS